MDFIASFFIVLEENHLDFCKNWVLKKIWLKNQNPQISKQFMGFVHLF